MAQPVKSNQKTRKSPLKEKHEKDALWHQRGVEDVYFQREGRVNFWTVLGGIAVAALLTQLTSLVEEIRAGHWYLLLYFLTLIILITNSWVQHLWGSLILRMQVTVLETLLSLTYLICQAILCLQVTNPLIFFATATFYILFAILLQVYIMKSGAWNIFTPERIKGIKNTLWLYLAFTILCCGAAANLFWFPSVMADIGWGSLALLGSIYALVMQHFGMKQERKDLGVP